MLFRHPNIVPFLGVRRAGPYSPVDLISKWMIYGELTRFLAKNLHEDPLRYIRHVISGLGFIHSLEMVHADLKGVRLFTELTVTAYLTFVQRNVLVDEHRHACIADFGHTVTMQRTGLPTSHVDANSGGTIAFMAPELLDSDGFGTPGEPTAASDIYALAILIWEVRMSSL
jgi:serine/threonine protein kinase